MPDVYDVKDKTKKTKHEIDHPTGTTLLSRDKPENRRLWGSAGIGYVDVAPSVCTASGQCPHYSFKSDATEAEAEAEAEAEGGVGQGGGGSLERPIHILIASYRDRLCGRTLHNAFRRATNPRRVFIRVIDQTLAGSGLDDDDGCWERYCSEYNEHCEELKDNVRTIHVDSKDSKGPTDARSKLSAMVAWDYTHSNDPDKLDFRRVQLQDFCMQIDSHMDFSDNYDTGLISMFHRTENDYAVLSTYVADISQNNKGIRAEVPNLCMVQFTSSIRNCATKECKNLIRPKLTNAMWGAGLSFHRCHAEINVPVDPYLDGVFDGEEGSRGLRFFTHGYDVYTPDTVLVTHDYHTHQGNPVVHTWGHFGGGKSKNQKEKEKSWNFNADIERKRPEILTKGSDRVNMILGIGTHTHDQQTEIARIRNSRFGIGHRRTLEQAGEFSGIDLKKKRMVENKCGNLIWVPFAENTADGYGYGVGEGLGRSLAGDDAEIDAFADHMSGTGADTSPRVAASGRADRGDSKRKGGALLPREKVKVMAAVARIRADALLNQHSGAGDKVSPRMAIVAASLAAVLIFIFIRLGRREIKRSRYKH